MGSFHRGGTFSKFKSVTSNANLRPMSRPTARHIYQWYTYVRSPCQYHYTIVIGAPIKLYGCQNH